MKTSESTKNIAAAIGILQQRVPYIGKDSKNYQNKYTSLPYFNEKVYPIMGELGLSIAQFPDNINGEPALTTRIMHAASDEWQESTFPLSKAGMAKVNDAQDWGAGIYYFRRYCVMAVLGIASDDDDAISLTKSVPSPAPKARPKPTDPQPTAALFKKAMGEALDVEDLEKARNRAKKYTDIWDQSCEDTYTDMLLVLTDPANQGRGK